MAKVRGDISMSVDGFVAGPNQTLEHPHTGRARYPGLPYVGLADAYRVVCPDMAGRGRSDREAQDEKNTDRRGVERPLDDQKRRAPEEGKGEEGEVWHVPTFIPLTVQRPRG